MRRDHVDYGQMQLKIENKSWGEETAIEVDSSQRVARGHMTEAFPGGIVGEGAVEPLLAGTDTGVAALVGFERVVGRIGDRSGCVKRTKVPSQFG
jgi:Protein of unknown function (DUF3224)